MSDGHLNPSAFLELRQSSLKALRGEEGLELPLERQSNGRLTDPCRQSLKLSLKAFLRKEIWQPRVRAYCAIGARGVSLRRLILPAAPRENLKQLLALQIEKEFPLPPEALAWGWVPVGGGDFAAVSAGKQEVLVVAVKKEVVEEYSDILSECGVAPIFTMAAMARRLVCPRPPRSCAVLDMGRDYSELITFENGVPTSVRVITWGGERITQGIQEKLSIGRDEAEKLKLQLAAKPSADGEQGRNVESAVDSALASLARSIGREWHGGKIYLSGRSAGLGGIAPRLERQLSNGTECESLSSPSGPGRSAAILGLRSAVEGAGEAPLLTLQSSHANGSVVAARPTPWKWIVLALGLVVASLSLPYLEAILLKGRLTRKLAAIQSDRKRMTMIDRELEFLRFHKQNQPPYLDALFVLAKAAPQGARLETLSMNRRGDLAWRGTMRDALAVSGFRTKLIESGFFANVSVEEQTPSPDRQKVTVRMSAQWKQPAERQSLNIGPTPEEIEKAKNRPKDTPGAPMPGMDMGVPSGPMMPSMPPGASPPRSGKRVSTSGPPVMVSPPPGAKP